MSEVRLPPANADAPAVAIKEGDDIEVSKKILQLVPV